MTSAKLLVVKNNFPTGLRYGNPSYQRLAVEVAGDIFGLVEKAFAEAHQQRRVGEGWQALPSVVEDSLVLFSYAPPGRTSHLSPLSMIARLRQTLRKDTLYITPEGNVYRPGIEFPIDAGRSIDIYRKILRSDVLIEKSYGPFWNCILFLGKIVLVFVRRLHGDQVVAFHGAENKSFFGSLYVRGNRTFVSVLGHEKTDILHGAQALLGVLAEDKAR